MAKKAKHKTNDIGTNSVKTSKMVPVKRKIFKKNIKTLSPNYVSGGLISKAKPT